jgi:hypothetical protein
MGRGGLAPDLADLPDLESEEEGDHEEVEEEGVVGPAPPPPPPPPPAPSEEQEGRQYLTTDGRFRWPTDDFHALRNLRQAEHQLRPELRAAWDLADRKTSGAVLMRLREGRARPARAALLGRGPTAHEQRSLTKEQRAAQKCRASSRLAHSQRPWPAEKNA